MEAFGLYLRNDRPTGLSLEFRGGFAGSDRAAFVARVLDAMGVDL